MANYLKVIQYVFFVSVVLTIVDVWLLDQTKQIAMDSEIVSVSIAPGSKPWYLKREKSKDELAEFYKSFSSAQVNHAEPGKQIHVELTASRINRLLRIIQDAEAKYRDQLEHLEVLMIERVLNYGREPFYFKQYEFEFNEFTTRDSKHLIVNDKFANMLDKRSDFYTIANPNKDLSKVPLKKVSDGNARLSRPLFPDFLFKRCIVRSKANQVVDRSQREVLWLFVQQPESTDNHQLLSGNLHLRPGTERRLD